MPRRAAPHRAIVDASNVAHSVEGEPARVDHILAMCDKLQDEGYEAIVVADAALRHQVTDADAFERLVARGVVHQAPAGTDADYFILNFARELDAVIVSNDRFRDRMDHFPELRRRIVRYMILAGEVVLERRGGRRDGKGKPGATADGAVKTGTSNKGASNKDASNNGASNRGASNKGASNKGASNNGASNNGASNNGTSDDHSGTPFGRGHNAKHRPH